MLSMLEMKNTEKVEITDELRKELNELSRGIQYAIHGFNVRKGFNFAKAKHPQEMAIYRLVKMTHEFWMKVELEDEDDF